ncbi:hypothetical protein ABG067_004817 [Albugo candida]
MTKRTRQRGLLHNSQLTDSDRRKIRCKERDILQDIRKNAKELATVTSTKFIETTEELNQVYEQICYPREANLDASNLEELNQAVVKQSQSLGSNNCQQYDATDLIRASRSNFASDGTFDWEKLGRTVASCFHCVPEINFFFGLMDTKVTEKQRHRSRRRRNDESIQTSQPTQYSAKNDRQDAQARRLETMRLALERSNRQNLFRVALHPQSFTQTIENLFDVSFLVRNGALEIGMDDNEAPYLEHHESRPDESMPAQTQTIISLTPDQWKELAGAMDAEAPLVGTREERSTNHIHSVGYCRLYLSSGNPNAFRTLFQVGKGSQKYPIMYPAPNKRDRLATCFASFGFAFHVLLLKLDTEKRCMDRSG